MEFRKFTANVDEQGTDDSILAMFKISVVCMQGNELFVWGLHSFCVFLVLICFGWPKI